MKETTNREQDRLLREALGRREGDADSVQGDLDDLLREAMGRRAERVPALSADFQERVMARLRNSHASHTQTPHPDMECPGGKRREFARQIPLFGGLFHRNLTSKFPTEDNPSTRRRPLGLLRLRSWRSWAWGGNIAAAVVVGWFVFFGHDGHDGLNGPDEGTANDSALAQEAIGTSSYTDVSLAQEAKVSQLPTPMRGGVRGGVGKGTAPASSSTKGRMLTQQVSVSSPSLQGRAGGGAITEQTLDADMSAFYASMEEIERSALREANTMTCEALGQACGATSPS